MKCEKFGCTFFMSIPIISVPNYYTNRPRIQCNTMRHNVKSFADVKINNICLQGIINDLRLNCTVIKTIFGEVKLR